MKIGMVFIGAIREQTLQIEKNISTFKECFPEHDLYE